MKSIIKITFVLFSLCIFSEHALGQNDEGGINKGFGLGFHISQHQNDYGLGLNFMSPMFANERMGVHLRTDVMFLQHLDNDSFGTTTWSPYGSFMLGLMGATKDINNFMRIYGEGGLVLLLNNSSFSSKTVNIGGYGLFGFEFFPSPKSGFNIELGGIFTGAVADEIVGKPIYSNGFLINVGYRHYF